MADLSDNQDWDVLLAPWLVGEGTLMPERDFTHWANPGWLSWNEHAMESQVAEFVASLAGEIAARSEDPIKVIETGTGQGFATRRVWDAIREHGGRLLAFESDVDWRAQLGLRVDFWNSSMDRKTLDLRPTFDASDISSADLTILDSMDPLRMGELCMWAALAKPGAYLFLHDAGNGHPAWDGHFTLGQIVRTLRLPGKWLDNPRGAFVARQDHEKVEPWVEDLWASILERVYDGGHG